MRGVPESTSLDADYTTARGAKAGNTDPRSSPYPREVSVPGRRIALTVVFTLLSAFVVGIAVYMVLRERRRRNRESAPPREEPKPKTVEGMKIELRARFEANRLVKTLTMEDFVAASPGIERPPVRSHEGGTARSENNDGEDVELGRSESDDGGDAELGESDPGKVRLDDGTTASNVCAICLETYEVGSAIAWSSNCFHAFHRDCIVSCLAHGGARKRASYACPCCRQNFLPECDGDSTSILVGDEE